MTLPPRAVPVGRRQALPAHGGTRRRRLPADYGHDRGGTRRRLLLAAYGDDRGSILPLVAGCFVVASLMVCGAVAASAAFLAQRDLASVCDGAAVAAAAAADEGRVYAGGAVDRLPLDDAGVRAAVTDHLQRVPPPVVAADADTDGQTVTVVCRRTVRIPFGAAFGYADGLEREAVASARSPLLG